MKKLFKFGIIGSLTSLLLLNCGKDDDDTPVIPPRDRQEVYDENIIEIETYLKENYITFDSENNATVTKIPA